MTGAVVFGAVIKHPAYIAVSLAAGGAYYIMLNGRRGLLKTVGFLPLVVFIAAVNPVFNTRGDTVLFELFGRPYTLEALRYGAATAAMFAATLLWCGCTFRVMGKEKLIFVTSRAAPTASLLTVMVLRLIPDVAAGARRAGYSRRALGKGASGGSRGRRIKSGCESLGALISRELERGVTTGDSMRSRGFGAGVRTSFAIYRMTSSDVALLIAALASIAALAVFTARGGASASYYPSVALTPVTGVNIVFFALYSVYLSIPGALRIKECVIWKYSRYGI